MQKQSRSGVKQEAQGTRVESACEFFLGAWVPCTVEAVGECVVLFQVHGDTLGALMLMEAYESTCGFVLGSTSNSGIGVCWDSCSCSQSLAASPDGVVDCCRSS
jgi:hypothetical protein